MRRFLLFLIGILSPTAVYAAGRNAIYYGFDCTKILIPLPGCGTSDSNPNYLATTALTKIAGTGLAIATPLATVIFLYGALRMVISRGDEGKDAGKKAMIYGAMGLVFVALSFGIVSMVQAYLYLL